MPDSGADATPARSRASRPQMPRYDGVSFDALLNQPPAEEQPDTGAAFRAPADPGVPEPVTTPVRVARQATQPRTESIAQPPVLPATPRAAADDDTASAPDGATLTRRQLRAMLQAQAANDDARNANDEEATERDGDVIVAESLPEPPRSDAPVPAPRPAASAPVIPEPPAPIVPAAPEPAQRSFEPPAAHVSLRGAESEDDDARTGSGRSVVSSGSTTTSNALILPVVPSAADATGPLTSTGEILVTGSIDLPRGLGSTGQHPNHFDTSDIDRLFEQAEGEGATPDVAPVRASRAVSTHTSTRNMITPPKARGTKLPTVLAITAGVLALCVVGLLVAGYVFKVF
jgi:hypothetical protein